MKADLVSIRLAAIGLQIAIAAAKDETIRAPKGAVNHKGEKIGGQWVRKSQIAKIETGEEDGEEQGVADQVKDFLENQARDIKISLDSTMQNVSTWNEEQQTKFNEWMTSSETGKSLKEVGTFFAGKSEQAKNVYDGVIEKIQGFFADPKGSTETAIQNIATFAGEAFDTFKENVSAAIENTDLLHATVGGFLLVAGGLSFRAAFMANPPLFALSSFFPPVVSAAMNSRVFRIGIAVHDISWALDQFKFEPLVAEDQQEAFDEAAKKAKDSDKKAIEAVKEENGEDVKSESEKLLDAINKVRSPQNLANLQDTLKKAEELQSAIADQKQALLQKDRQAIRGDIDKIVAKANNIIQKLEQEGSQSLDEGSRVAQDAAIQSVAQVKQVVADIQEARNRDLSNDVKEVVRKGEVLQAQLAQQKEVVLEQQQQQIKKEITATAKKAQDAQKKVEQKARELQEKTQQIADHLAAQAAKEARSLQQTIEEGRNRQLSDPVKSVLQEGESLRKEIAKQKEYKLKAEQQVIQNNLDYAIKEATEIQKEFSRKTTNIVKRGKQFTDRQIQNALDESQKFKNEIERSRQRELSAIPKQKLREADISQQQALNERQAILDGQQAEIEANIQRTLEEASQLQAEYQQQAKAIVEGTAKMTSQEVAKLIQSLQQTIRDAQNAELNKSARKALEQIENTQEELNRENKRITETMESTKLTPDKINQILKKADFNREQLNRRNQRAYEKSL